jgi:hypothetical protein
MNFLASSVKKSPFTEPQSTGMAPPAGEASTSSNPAALKTNQGSASSASHSPVGLPPMEPAEVETSRSFTIGSGLRYKLHLLLLLYYVKYRDLVKLSLT